MYFEVILTAAEEALRKDLIQFTKRYESFTPVQWNSLICREDFGFSSPNKKVDFFAHAETELSEAIAAFKKDIGALPKQYLEVVSLSHVLLASLKGVKVTNYLSTEQLGIFVETFFESYKPAAGFQANVAVTMTTIRLNNHNSLPFYQEAMEHLRSVQLVAAVAGKSGEYTLLNADMPMLIAALKNFYSKKLMTLTLADLVTQQQSRSALGKTAASTTGGQRNVLIDQLLEGDLCNFRTNLQQDTAMYSLYEKVRTLDHCKTIYEEIVIKGKLFDKEANSPLDADIKKMLCIQSTVMGLSVEQYKINLSKELLWIDRLIARSIALSNEKKADNNQEEESPQERKLFFSKMREVVGNMTTMTTQAQRHQLKILFHQGFQAELQQIRKSALAQEATEVSVANIHQNIEALLARKIQEYKTAFSSGSFETAIRNVPAVMDQVVIKIAAIDQARIHANAMYQHLAIFLINASKEQKPSPHAWKNSMGASGYLSWADGPSVKPAASNKRLSPQVLQNVKELMCEIQKIQTQIGANGVSDEETGRNFLCQLEALAARSTGSEALDGMGPDSLRKVLMNEICDDIDESDLDMSGDSQTNICVF